jgi:hypothetical protein
MPTAKGGNSFIMARAASRTATLLRRISFIRSTAIWLLSRFAVYPI